MKKLMSLFSILLVAFVATGSFVSCGVKEENSKKEVLMVDDGKLESENIKTMITSSKVILEETLKGSIQNLEIKTGTPNGIETIMFEITPAKGFTALVTTNKMEFIKTKKEFINMAKSFNDNFKNAKFKGDLIFILRNEVNLNNALIVVKNGEEVK